MRVLLPAILVALCAGGCSGTVDSGGDGGAAGDPSCGGIHPSIVACNTCTNSRCCDKGVACGKDSKCSALMGCVTQCPLADTICVQACKTQFPNAGASASAWLDCATADCSVDCSCGGMGTGCTFNLACCSGKCLGGKCTVGTSCRGPRESCATTADCCQGHVCYQTTCCGEFKTACSTTADCCPGMTCTSGHCAL